MPQRAQHRSATSRGGRGRHRKPNPHTRTLGLATAPLVAAIPLAAASASPASAATSAWDRLASCESGENWHINTGNGYYGGLQFADGTWDGNGGGKYASRADLASRAEQIVIAAKVLDGRGWSPWPACSSRLGLDGADRREALATADDLRAQLDGSQNAGDATKAASSGGSSGGGGGNGGGGNGATDAATRAADNHSVQTERATRSERRTAHLGKHRMAHTAADVYVVRRGDTLSGIARNRSVPGGWQALYRINRHTIGSNPGLIRPGQQLHLG